MSFPILFVIDDESISVEQVPNYLFAASKFQASLQEILRQPAIARELQRHPELNSTPSISEQVLKDFQRENQLLSQNDFQDWLKKNNFSYSALHEQLIKQ